MNKVETLLNDLNETLNGNPVFIFPNHKFAYGYVFGEDLIKTSKMFYTATLQAGTKSVLDICKSLDKQDSIALYNVCVSNGVITIKAVIPDESIITALDLSNGDFEMAGLID